MSELEVDVSRQHSYRWKFWDNYDVLYQHLDDGLSTMKDVVSLFEEFTAQFSAQGKRMMGVKVGRGGETGSLSQAWNTLRNSSTVLGQNYLNMSNKLSQECVSPMQRYIKEFSGKRDDTDVTYKAIVKEYKEKEKALEKAKLAYIKSAKESELQSVKYLKAQLDLDLVKKKLIEIAAVCANAKKEAELAEKTYVQCLADFRNFLVEYERKMTDLLDGMEVLERSREDTVRNLFGVFVSITTTFHTDSMEICNMLRDGVSSTSVNIETDIKMFSESKGSEYKGITVPDRYYYEYSSLIQEEQDFAKANNGIPPVTCMPERAPDVPSLSLATEPLPVRKPEEKIRGAGAAGPAVHAVVPTIDEPPASQAAPVLPPKRASREAKRTSVLQSTPLWAGIALYDHVPSGQSDEIKMNAGDMVFALDVPDTAGWMRVQVGDAVGVVPAAFVRRVYKKHSGGGYKGHILFDYSSDNTDVLHVVAGDEVVISHEDSNWYWVSKGDIKGVVPVTIVEVNV